MNALILVLLGALVAAASSCWLLYGPTRAK